MLLVVPTPPTVPLSTRLMSKSICSNCAATGEATMRRFCCVSAMTRALVAAALPVSFGSATPGIACRMMLAKSSGLMDVG